MIKLDKPKNNVDALIRYMNHSDIILTAEQEDLFVRLTFVDGLLRSRKYTRDDVINMMRKRFTVSLYRATQDITDAHRLFGETRKLSKNYLISHHIEEIGLQIKEARATGCMKLLPKLNENYTHAINSIPRENDESESPPAKIIFVFTGAPKQEKQNLMSLLMEADNYIKGKIPDGSYIEFKDLGKPGGPDHTGGAERTTDDGSDDIGE